MRRAIAVLTLVACGPAPVPLFSLSARPKVVDAAGTMEATVSVDVLQEDGKPRTGTVKLVAQAGEFKSGSAETRLTLAMDGTATTTFSCAVAADPNCVGSVRIDGRWDDGMMTGQFLVAALRIDVKAEAP